MGAAAYRRGSRAISLQADAEMPAAIARTAQQTQADETACLKGSSKRWTAGSPLVGRCVE